MRRDELFCNKIDEIRKALKLELYNSALALALTLPDICGKVAFPEDKSKPRYIKWFDKYVRCRFVSSCIKLPEEKLVEYQWITSEECYALRCAVLHAGDYNAQNVKLSQIHFHAHKRNGENYSHIIRNDQYIDVDVIDFCEKLCQTAEEYYNSMDDQSRFNLDEVRIDTW